MAKKRKKKLTYWQRVYLTLKIRTKRALRSFAKELSHYKMPRNLKLILTSIVLLIVLFFGGKYAIHSYRINTQTKYGYTKQEAQLLLDTKLQSVTKEYGYSSAFIKAVENSTYDEQYTPLYFYTDTVNEESKLYYDRLLTKEYSQEEIKSIFENLKIHEILPLLVYEKQDDLAQFYTDTKKDALTKAYINPYENAVIQNSIEIDSLINKKYGLSSDFEPETLTSISKYCAFNPGKLIQEAATAFDTMCMDAKKENVYFASMVAYQSYEEQEKRYNSYQNQYGSLQVDDYASRPGFDEHQSGLALNVSSMASNPAGVTFEQTSEYAWLVEHAADYGFIFRYPSGKEHITGMNAEPKHLRYVGIELAQLLVEEDLTLEEFYALYK